MSAVVAIRDTHVTKVCSSSHMTFVGAGCCEARLVSEETCGAFFLCDGLQRQNTYVIADGDTETIDLTGVPDDCFPGSVDFGTINDLTIVNQSCDGEVEITFPTPILAGESILLESQCHFSLTSNTGWAAGATWELTIKNTGTTEQTIKVVIAGAAA